MPHLHLAPTSLDGSGGTGRIRAVVADDPHTTRTRAVWTAGDFDHIARGFATSAEEFVARLGLRTGERVLDVACGTGNLALPAARAGAEVVGLDIAPNLLETARRHAAMEELAIRFDEGNAESLPYPDASFDTVVTMFGAMFAARPEKAAAELLRVTRPGGRVVMANWTGGGFVGRMLRAHVARVAPPADIPSTLLWGDPAVVAERLGAEARVETTHRRVRFTYPVPPAGTVALFREWYGPTVRTFAALGPQAQIAFQAELEQLWTEANLATDGTTVVESEYLEVRATVHGG